MCLHVLRQLHRLLSVWGEMVNVAAITVVPVSLLSSYQHVLCVQCVCAVLCCGPVCVWPFCVWSVLCCESVSALCLCVFGLCVLIQNVSVCRFKTSPCLPANARVSCDTGVLPVNTEAF